VVRDDGVSFSVRPDVIADVPFYLNDPSVPGGRRFNTAAFRNPPTLPGGFPARQGNFGRNVLRELPLYQFDFALGKSFMLSEQLRLQFKGEVFNIFNHPMFALYSSAWTNQTTFGIPSTTMSSGLGGLSALYQLGGPRSVQLSARLSF
jgi:hypothetical protein